MRDNMTPDLVTALDGSRITTALLGRFEFKSETIFAWTGVGRLAPVGSGDTMLEGNIFEPLNTDIVDFGENTYSYSGSSELVVTLNMGDSPSAQLIAAQTYAAEYQSRPVIIWRGVMIPQSDPLAKPVWAFRRIRTGSMAKIEDSNDGLSSKLTLTIESHQARISSAPNTNWLNQKVFDPNDTSNDFAVSIANGDPAPTRGSASSAAGSGLWGAGGAGRQALYAIQRLF